jgi:hypothetical protein
MIQQMLALQNVRLFIKLVSTISSLCVNFFKKIHQCISSNHQRQYKYCQKQWGVQNIGV